jgi:hypothetical protein
MHTRPRRNLHKKFIFRFAIQNTCLTGSVSGCLSPAQKMKKKNARSRKILSAHAIARRLHRSPQGVIDAIERLGIAPVLELPSARYYAECQVPVIAAGMRRPNGVPKQA